MGYEPDWDRRVTDAPQPRPRPGPQRLPARPRSATRSLLDEMRLVKDAAESRHHAPRRRHLGGAHRRAMAHRPGAFEYESRPSCSTNSAATAARPGLRLSIVAGGPNACVLHYVENNRRLQDGDLLLIDAGCELDGYASDITRTFPVNGRFSGPQKAVYELVLAAQAAAIAIRPGIDWNAPTTPPPACWPRASSTSACSRAASTACSNPAATASSTCTAPATGSASTCTDAGEYKTGGEWRLLAAGNVLTVEPGTYIRPADGVPEAFWNIGIRIEDDALVTPAGCDIITHATPKSVADIEALMAEARRAETRPRHRRRRPGGHDPGAGPQGFRPRHAAGGRPRPGAARHDPACWPSPTAAG